MYHLEISDSNISLIYQKQCVCHPFAHESFYSVLPFYHLETYLNHQYNPVSQKLSIIDGLQRICAIRDFVLKKDEPLKLEGLQFLKNFEGVTFSQLARPEVKRIKSLKITMNTLRKGTPLDVKYIIFQRVNTAGEPLTPQEMRHALNQGPAAIFLKELADMESFKKRHKSVYKISILHSL